MKFRIRPSVLSLAFALLVATALVSAQQTPLDDEIPLDPAVTHGEFDNGLKYYIQANNEPENRAELRLVVNVGSIVEDDDQLGLAHFVEHMAFNGTENFPKQALVEFMESIGMRFGPGVNASTSFDETIYMLRVPTDTPEAIETAFQIMEDWAHRLSFEPEEIDQERGVIIEEWRLRRGAAARMQDQQFPVLLKGSHYAERIPIGTVENLETFPHESLTRFYQDWYRPDLMAVVAVGDFDEARVQALVDRHFASLPTAESPRPRPTPGVPDHDETLFAITSDPEAPSASVAVYAKFDPREAKTYGAYRRSLVEGLFSGMLGSRMSELAQKPGAPFVMALGGRGALVRGKEAAILTTLVKEDGILEGLTAAFREVERVARFGFNESELERLKTNRMRSLERALAERDNRSSLSWASRYIGHFLRGAPVPSLDLQFELATRFLPEITVEEVNSLAADWIPEANRVVVVAAPEKEGLVLPDEAELMAAIAAAAEGELEAYVDAVDDEPLLAEIPEPGTIVSEAPPDEWGIIEWDLSNGVRVAFFPTDFREDQIVFRGISPGGTSLASDEDYVPASSASAVIGAGGIGSFNAIDLRKKLTGKVASARASIGSLEESVGGSSSVKDLETAFQLIYMAFTQPRPDPEMFEVFVTQNQTMLTNQEVSPAFHFNRALTGIMTQNHPRSEPITLETLKELDLGKSFAFYQDRFADASDFTFVFVGSLDLDVMRPLVARYLGSLPSIDREETWRDTGMRRPRGVIERVVEKGLEPQSRTAIRFTGPFEYTQENRLAARTMASVLQTRLREVLREDLGGTYSVSAAATLSLQPIERYQVSISFGSGPEQADELSVRVFEEIEKLKADGPTEQEVNDAIAAFVRSFETSMESNSYLLGQILFKYRYDKDLRELFEADDAYRAVTVEAAHEAARNLLDMNNYVKVVLMPEGGGR